MINKIHPGSFRDQNGFVFFRNNTIYRQINRAYIQNYKLLTESGLYENLVHEGLLISHEEVSINPEIESDAYKIIKPVKIPFISYPGEWCFSQLHDAAKATLEIQKISMEYGMSLKDSSAFNIQFLKGRPVLIDTLSFEQYDDSRPWVAYRQFCQHFFAPLTLMSYRDIRLNQLFRIYLDGIPLDLTGSLLPVKSYLRCSLLTHIHLHSKFQIYFSGRHVDIERKKYKIHRHALPGLINSLEAAVNKLKYKNKKSEWSEYSCNNNYTPEASEHKKEILSFFLDRINPESLWDLGANTGEYSRIASGKNIQTVSLDIDPHAVEKNYLESVRRGDNNLLPLVMDLTNPTPGMGWENNERGSLIERGPADAVVAFALIHHMVISNNIPFQKVAGFFRKICRYLIIEFIPRSDSQVERLLSYREDIFFDYTSEVFEREFSRYFKILRSTEIKNSGRSIYLMEGV